MLREHRWVLGVWIDVEYRLMGLLEIKMQILMAGKLRSSSLLCLLVVRAIFLRVQLPSQYVDCLKMCPFLPMDLYGDSPSSRPHSAMST